MIKRTPADDYFSKCVRERVNYICERCHTMHLRSSTGLHCSHYFGRKNTGVRHHPDNGFALCHGCHSLLGGDPEAHTAFVEGKLGEGRLQMLREVKNDTDAGRMINQAMKRKEVAKHYRGEWNRMKALRDAGEVGRIEFEGFL